MDREVKRKLVHTLVAAATVPFLLFFELWLGVVLSLASVAVITLVWWLERRGEHLKGPAGEAQDLVAHALEETRRPGEDYPGAPVYFVAGLMVVAGLSEYFGIALSLAFAAYAVLGVGDTASALIGKAYGSMKIPWNPKKSWEGTGAGVGSAYPWAILFSAAYYVYYDALFPGHMYWIVLAGTLAGMLAETLPGEDNFTIPVSSWAAMVGLGALVGVG